MFHVACRKGDLSCRQIGNVVSLYLVLYRCAAGHDGRADDLDHDLVVGRTCYLKGNEGGGHRENHHRYGDYLSC